MPPPPVPPAALRGQSKLSFKAAGGSSSAAVAPAFALPSTAAAAGAGGAFSAGLSSEYVHSVAVVAIEASLNPFHCTPPRPPPPPCADARRLRPAAAASRATPCRHFLRARRRPLRQPRRRWSATAMRRSAWRLTCVAVTPPRRPPPAPLRRRQTREWGRGDEVAAMALVSSMVAAMAGVGLAAAVPAGAAALRLWMTCAAAATRHGWVAWWLLGWRQRRHGGHNTVAAC